MKLIIAFLIFCAAAWGQCAPLVMNPITGQLDCVGSSSGGTVAATSGGTGLTSYSLGDLIYSSAANTLSALAGNITATKKFLCQTGTGAVSAAPSWCTIIAGDLPATAVQTNQANTFSTGAQSFAAATSLAVPTSAGAAPVTDGLIAYDSTRSTLVVGSTLTGTAGKVPRVLYHSASSSDTLSCDVIGAATETPFSQSYQLPANFFNVANKAIEIRAGVQFTTSGSAPTYTFKIRTQKAGPTNVSLYLPPAQAIGNNLTNLGSGTSVMLTGTAAAGAAASMVVSPMSAWTTSTSVINGRNTVAQPIAVDTTAAQTIGVTFTCSANTAANSMTLLSLTILEIN